MQAISTFLLSLIFFLFFEIVSAQSTFQKTYGSINNDDGISFVMTNNEGFAILSDENNGIGSWINILKVDSTGNIVWKTKFKSTLNELHAIDIKATPDSGFIIESNYYETSGGQYSNLLLIKLNKDGDTLWTKSYSCNGNWNQIATIGEIIVTSDGGYAITGTAYPTRMFFLKTDSLGNIIWFNYYPANASYGFSLKQTNDGDYMLCGAIWDARYKSYLVKTNAIGDTLYTRIFDDNIYPGVEANYMDLTNNNGFIISGEGHTFGSLLRLDSSANLMWAKKYPSLAFQTVKTYSNGFVIVASDTLYPHKELYLLKTDSAGNIIWNKSFGGPSFDLGKCVITYPNSFFILGTTRNYSHGLNDVYLIKADDNGSVSCHEDSLTITASTASWTQSLGGILDSGYLITQSTISIDTSAYEVYDDCICVPPISSFRNDSVCCSISFSDYSTWADSWHWDFGDGDTSNLENVSHQYSAIATYQVCLTVSNSCGSDTYCDSLKVIPVGINEQSTLSNIFTIFPNPSNGRFELKFNSNINHGLIKVTNIVGVELYSEKCSGDRKSICINLNAGIYFVQVADNDKYWREKIVIE